MNVLMPTKGISVLISNNKIKLSSLKKKGPVFHCSDPRSGRLEGKCSGLADDGGWLVLLISLKW